MGAVYQFPTSWSIYCSVPRFVEECDRTEYKRKPWLSTTQNILCNFYLKNISSKICSWNFIGYEEHEKNMRSFN